MSKLKDVAIVGVVRNARSSLDRDKHEVALPYFFVAFNFGMCIPFNV